MGGACSAYGWGERVIQGLGGETWGKETIWKTQTWMGRKYYRGADKSLAQPYWKKQLKGRHFSSDAEVIAAAETWLDGQLFEFFLSGLQKLEQRAKKCIELRGEYVE